MRNLYLVQASNTYVGRGFKAAYLPYAVGLLAACAFEDETIKNEYCQISGADAFRGNTRPHPEHDG